MPTTRESLLKRLNTRLGLVEPSDILAFSAEVAALPDMISLTLGEPDFNTPEHVKQAGINSIANDESHYAASNGTQGLRQAAAHFLATKYDVHYDPATEIIVTIGATEAIYTALASVLNAGDKVIIPTPIFPLYIPITLVNGGTPVFIDTSENGFVLSPTMLEAAIAEHGTAIKAVVLNFPSNPTGVTYSAADIQALAKVLQQHDIFVISDEIYSELTYEQQHVSMAQYLPEQTILINGVSKSHAMTGYRIGIMAAPAAITQQLGKIHQFTITAPVNAAMAAAQEAFENGMDDTQVMKVEYQKRRDFVYERLTALGFEIAKPQGAFYIFAKIPAGLNQVSMEFARDLAHKNHLAIIPGGSFGPGGEGYIRISYAASMEVLNEAMQRMTAYVTGNQKG